MIFCWAQEIIGQHFIVIHRTDCILGGIYALTYRFGPLIAKHLAITAIIRYRYQVQYPKAYVAATFIANKTSIIQNIQDRIPPSVLVNKFIAAFTVKPGNKPTADTHITPPV